MVEDVCDEFDWKGVGYCEVCGEGDGIERMRRDGLLERIWVGDGEDSWDGIRVNVVFSKTVCEFKMGAGRGETAEGGEEDELVVGEALVRVEDGSRDDIFTLHILVSIRW